MKLEQKVDELMSLVKAIDTKFMFIQDDLDVIKEQVATINDTVINVTMKANEQSDSSGKAQRLEKFREQTSRW